MKRMHLTLTVVACSVIMLSLYQFASAHGDHGSGKLSEHDLLRIAAQKICPVSGKKLGSMGHPLKVKIGEEELFLCCKGCASGKISREHWATIHANFAQAQGKCPVMKKDLPKSPKWTVVNGHIVYVCCPPCVDKIKADPKKYLAQVHQYYRTNLARQKIR